MLQIGDHQGQTSVAGAVSAGAGYNFADKAMNPTFWIYYDWASGDNNPKSGPYTTFNQLFSFGHYYMGWIDLVGRQNVHDVNLHMYLYPTKWLTTNIQYHNFHLSNRHDALYNAAGNATRWDPSGKAGTNIGNELDFIFNFHLGPRSDILTGYSHLFAGDFIRNTGNGQTRNCST